MYLELVPSFHFVKKWITVGDFFLDHFVVFISFPAAMSCKCMLIIYIVHMKY